MNFLASHVFLSKLYMGSSLLFKGQWLYCCVLIVDSCTLTLVTLKKDLWLHIGYPGFLKDHGNCYRPCDLCWLITAWENNNAFKCLLSFWLWIGGVQCQKLFCNLFCSLMSINSSFSEVLRNLLCWCHDALPQTCCKNLTLIVTFSWSKTEHVWAFC